MRDWVIGVDWVEIVEFMEDLVEASRVSYGAGFEGLEVWREARQFRLLIRDIVRMFPADEKYRLTDQIIRASRSTTANIAEGYGRFHYQENIQFCRQARGSLTERLDHLICATDEGYITQEMLTSQRIQYDKVLRLLNGYISYLKERKAGNG